MNQKGISSIVIILIIVGVLAIGGGIWYLQNQQNKLEAFCIKEAKICPDGTSVERTGPNCEFAACPGVKNETVNWQTYRNEEYGYEVKYPAEMDITIPETPGLIEIHSIELGGFNISYADHYDSSQNRHWTKEDMANQTGGEKEQIILSGLPAIKITYYSGVHKIIDIFAQKSNDTKIYWIDIEPTEEEFSLVTLSQILFTFKFTK